MPRNGFDKVFNSKSLRMIGNWVNSPTSNHGHDRNCPVDCWWSGWLRVPKSMRVFSWIKLDHHSIGDRQRNLAANILRDERVKLRVCPYSCKIQTGFTPACFPGKHLLSYYRQDVNVADVWARIYMTIQQLLNDFMVAMFPTGSLVPLAKYFPLHVTITASGFHIIWH